MAITNLIDIPWLPVRYLDGTKAMIGIRTAMQDAEKIQELLSPEFRNDRCPLYRMAAMRFLSTIVMSAYYKKKNNYAAKQLDYAEDLRQNGLYSDTIREYLDEWHDHFDLYDSEHPFLQNTALNEFPEKERLVGEYRTWGPYAPDGNNKLFGRVRTADPTKKEILDQYDMSKEEYAYFLLYMACVGTSNFGKHYKENSIRKKETIFLELKGDTLAESILLNIVPLESSSRPDEDDEDRIADRPGWELDRPKDVEQMDASTLPNNLLICSFLPAISFLCVEHDENGNPVNVIRNRIANSKKENDCYADRFEEIAKHTIAPEFAEKLWLYHNDPYTIILDAESKKMKKENSKDDRERPYYCFHYQSDTASKMCIEATRVLADKRLSCRLLEENVSDNTRVVIYFREFTNAYRTTIANAGVISGHNAKTWMLLRDPLKNEMAKKYQNFYANVKIILRRYLAEALMLPEKKVDKKSPVLNQTVRNNAYSDLSNWIEDDFFRNFTNDLQEENSITKAMDRMIKKTIKIYEHYTRNAHDLIRVYIAEAKLAKALQNEKENCEAVSVGKKRRKSDDRSTEA